MCSLFKVSRSGYYNWLDRKPSDTEEENKMILGKIKQIHKQSRCTYGSPRVTAELNDRGVKVSKPRVARLMKQAGIRSIRQKKYRVTTDSKHNYRVNTNLLDRNFNAQEIAKAWVSDITYIKTTEGWLYLTVIIDLADRKVVGWALSQTMKAKETIIPAWTMARANRSITGSLIFHSDRGVQYACDEFRLELKKSPSVRQSMSRKGNCWDNAVAESFFKTLKTELVYHHCFKTRKQANLMIFEFIEVWYNRKRRHSAIGYLSPEQKEQVLINQLLNAA